MRLPLTRWLAAAWLAGIAPSLASLPTHGARQQRLPCQRTVWDGAETQFPYRERDNNRCEGVYAQPLFSSPLRVVGFGPLPPAADTGQDSAEIVWEARAADTVFVRSEVVRTQAYYQMDTRVLPGARRFPWSLQVARLAGHSLPEFDLVCWTHRNALTRRLAVLVPCRFAPQQRSSTAGTLRLLTGEPIRSARVTVARVTAAGPDAPLGPPRSLGGPYGTGHLFSIPIVSSERGVLYHVTVETQLVNGVPHTDDFWIERT